MGHAENKRERIEQIEHLLLFAQDGLTPTEIAKKIGCDRSSVHRYLDEIGQKHYLINDAGHYHLDPTQYVAT